MTEPNSSSQQRQIARWLLAGVAMIMVQVLLGGITRLTESGLSITEWKPITGMLPPLTAADWASEFEKYRHTDQFRFVHQHFSLSEFKFIYFWEWFHRFWARMMGVVFLVGFVYFLVRRRFSRDMILPMVLLFLLGGMQGAIGWIMVKSGLVPEKFYVGHVELTTHFLAAMLLLAYTLWFATGLLPAFRRPVPGPSLKGWLVSMTLLLVLQLGLGGFMAGLKAAQVSPTWPMISIPADSGDLLYMTHFLHRGVGYALLVVSILFFISTRSHRSHPLFITCRRLYLLLIGAQVLLGISALLSATSPTLFIWIGVAHQATAMLLIAALTVFWRIRPR